MSSTEGSTSPLTSSSDRSTANPSLDRLRETVAGGIDERTAPTALELTLDSVKVKHGALLIYDADRQSLSLLAQRNLAPEAQAAMRSIRRGVAGVWDMPLHSLLQRRVYMIERPKENPFVPVLLDGSDQAVLSNLVFLPLYSGGSASGVLLLVGSGARAVREPDIVALREHAKILGAALRRTDRAASRPVPEAPPSASGTALDRAALTARIAELEALVESLRKTSASSPTSLDGERRVLEISRERDRLQADLAARDIDLVSSRSELDLLRQRNAEEAERARNLALELSRIRGELAAFEDRDRRSGEERDRIERSRSELEVRLQGLERRLAKSMEHARETQSERASLSMRAAQGEAEANELRKLLALRDSTVSDLRGERDRLAASLHAAATRAQESEETLARAREDTAETIAALQGRVEAAEARAQSAERERDQLRAGSGGDSSVVEEIARETAAMRAELAREIERRRAAEETSSSVIRDASALRAELERAQNDWTALNRELSDARVENQRLSEELQRTVTATQALGESLRTAEDRVSEVSRRVKELERERAEVEGEFARSQEELGTRRAREEEALAHASTVEAETQKLRAKLERLEATLAASREETRAAHGERDAMAKRAAVLEEKLDVLLREHETTRAKREAELTAAHETIAVRDENVARLETERDAARSEIARLRHALSAESSGMQAELSRREELERQTAELRDELEIAQAHGSRLTEELEKRVRVEEELRARADTLETELDRQREQLRADGEERQALTARLREMEEVLRGASPDLAHHAADVDALAILRATLERSESARRSAEESVERLQDLLKTERQTTEEARAAAETERQTAGELAIQMEDVERRLRQAESTAEAASRRAEELTADHAAAVETSRSLATELGRRKAELDERSDQLRSRDGDLREAHTVAEQSLERIRSLEQNARATAADILALKKKSEAVEEEKQELVRRNEAQLAEANARLARLEEQLTASVRERDKLLETLRSAETHTQEREDFLRAAVSRHGEAERALFEARAQIQKLDGEIESLRRQSESMQQEVRVARSETERWQGLNEKLQRSLDERDRDLAGLRGAMAAFRKAKEIPQEGVVAPLAVPLAAAPTASRSREPEPAEAVTVASKPRKGRPTPAEAPPLGSGAPQTDIAAAAARRTVMIFDEKGPSFDSIAALCHKAGLEPRAVENGAPADEPPRLVIVNLLATTPPGFDAIRRSRTEAGLRDRPIVLYAAKPGSAKGLMLPNVECLIRPVEEPEFTRAVTSLIGGGKRITIIGEDLDSVLRFNGWATATGCSVSSAGDLKQGSDLLDIVKPDLIVFDFSRLSGEAAGLIVKVRRSTRLETLPLLIVLPREASPAAALFLKRLAMLAEEGPLDWSQLEGTLLRS